MDTVRMGLVGCGNFGISHLEALEGASDVEVAAVYDLDRGRAEAVAGRFGIAQVCGSLDEICALDGLDAIDVVSSEEHHCEPVLAALGAGRHVFVEKPLATTMDDCVAMIDAAERADRILMVGHLLRFENKYRLVKRELDAGRLGSVVSMHARRNRPKSLLPTYGRTHPALENCIHDVDIMLWLTGRRVERVRGFGRKATGGRHDDTFWGVIEFEGGAIGVVETIWLLPAAGVQLDDALQLIGTGGVANLALFPGPLSFWREDGYDVPDVSYTTILRDELLYFAECVRAGRKPEIVTPREAMRAVEVVLALIESARTGKGVTL